MKKIQGLHISEHKGHKEMSLKHDMVYFLNPEYIYIPLIEQNAPCTPCVAVGDHVLVGQAVATKTGRFGLPVHSSVSGEVTSIDKKMWHSMGKMVPCIEIKNDFLETMVEDIKPNDVDSLTKDDIVGIMRECGIVGLGGASFPTYVKNSGDAQIDYLLINAAECEPYINNDYMILKHDEFREKFIRGVKYAMISSGAKEAVIAIKKNKTQLIEKLEANLVEYPNINIYKLNDVYPAGWEKYIVQKVTKRTYNVLPSEVKCVVNNVGTIFSLCDAVENNKPLIEKIVTFTGKGLKDPCVVYTKIGAKVSDCIKQLGGYVESLDPSNTYFIAGGPMTGRSIMFDTIVINRSFGSVIVMPKEEKVSEMRCLGCGKCAEYCPVDLSPILIKNAVKNNDIKAMEELCAIKCMQCGLCSYICPSKIELTEAVGKARTTVLKK